MKKSRLLPILVVLALAVAAVAFAAMTAGPASGLPSFASTCNVTGCHAATPVGNVTATPSTTTPAPNATYTLTIANTLTASGNSGYWISGNGVSMTGGPAASTSFTVTMTAPATAGSYTYTVWVAKGTPSSGGMARSTTYTITVTVPTPAPTITSHTPTSGPVGTAVTITGTNFGATKGTSTVQFGTTVAATTAWSATSITATVPSLVAGTSYNISVTTAGGTSTGTHSFAVTAAAPALTSLTPNNGLAGSSVVIAGSNFGATQGSSTVTFSGTAATVTAWSATSITATVPAITPGAKSVVVTVGGQASNALTYTVNTPPGKDTTPPTTRVTGAVNGGWYNRTVTLCLTATDNVGGSGVASITYKVDGGAWKTVSGSSASVKIYADLEDHEKDGAHTVTYYATDKAGNVEAKQTFTVNIDTRKPTTKAPYSAKVDRYETAYLKYMVVDASPNGGTATVCITIKDHDGHVVKTLSLGSQPVNTLLTAKFTCSLPVGTYKFYVTATDRAGNTQANIACNTLTVYKAASHD